MSIENFLQGFFETGAKINIEKAREERALEREKMLRAERNADELKMYTDKITIKTKAERESAEAKERRRQRQYAEAKQLSQLPGELGSSDSLESGPSGATLQDLYNIRARFAANSYMFDDDVRDHRLEELQLAIDAKENENKPRGSALTADMSKLMDSVFLPDRKSLKKESPLFEAGVKIPLRFTEGELRALGTTVGKISTAKGVEVEEVEEGVFNIYTPVVDPTKSSREVRQKLTEEFYKSNNRARSLAKDLSTLDGNPSMDSQDIHDAFIIERAANTFVYSRDPKARELAKQTMVRNLNRRNVSLEAFFNTPYGQKAREVFNKAEISRDIKDIATDIFKKSSVGKFMTEPNEPEEAEIPPPPAPPTLDGPKPINALGIANMKKIVKARPNVSGEEIIDILDKGGFTITEEQLKEIFSDER